MVLHPLIANASLEKSLINWNPRYSDLNIIIKSIEKIYNSAKYNGKKKSIK